MNKYNFKKKEKNIYNYWQKNNLSIPDINNINKKNFSIIMPPPNITGNLHIGHAYQQTIMDIIIRYNKMKNKNILWLMGTDHAGIATQILVENYLKKKYNKKYLLNKKKIINELWKWKEKYENKINKQTKLLGSLVDWTRTRFTLDKNFSYSVKKAFIILYNNNLIYKKKKIINWDYKAKTVVSDIEIKKKSKLINKYYIKFKILNNKNYLIISIKKPESILAISAIIINYKIKNKLNINNKYIINPINKNLIKIIFNKNINKYKKIIPSFYNKDLNYSKKKKINIINIFNLNGTIKKIPEILNYKKKIKKIKKIKKNPIWIKNLNIISIRKKIINFLKKKKYIINKKKININIKYSIKTNTIIIPILMNQWYIKTYNLSKEVIKTIKNKKILFYPNKYKNLFFHWIKNIKDWCISRQIYWGHQIPVWYDKYNNQYVGYNKKYIEKKYNININNLKQDKNVLDTWFSSSIWTFASLGWPKKKIELNLFHPFNIVVSGYDIIFFWIAKMIMMTLYLFKKNNIKQIPFKKVFITGLIRDENGKKMSKSLGNVIDINDLVEGISLKKLIKKRTFNLLNKNKKNIIKENTIKIFPNGIKPNNVDVIRFTLTSITTNTLKINFNLKKNIYGYNYFNKLKNSCIYIIKIIKKNTKIKKININKLLLIEYWILNKFNNLLLNYHYLIKNFKFNKLCNFLFNFLKKNFCDWYIESIKINKKINNNFIIYIINNILKISHPITPFITEYYWLKINKNILNKNKCNSILLQKIPKYINKYNNKEIIKNFNIIKKIIIFLRKIKRKYKNFNINKLIIINLNLLEKKCFIENIYLFKIINIYKIYFFKKKIFNLIIKKYKKYTIPKLIYKNIYISYILN